MGFVGDLFGKSLPSLKTGEVESGEEVKPHQRLDKQIVRSLWDRPIPVTGEMADEFHSMSHMDQQIIDQLHP